MLYIGVKEKECVEAVLVLKGKAVCSGCLCSQLGTCLNVDSTGCDSGGMSMMGDLKPRASQQASVSESPSSWVVIHLHLWFLIYLYSNQPLTPSFVWGSVLDVMCVELLDCCYREAVHWVQNLLKVPSGRCGKDFVLKLVRLLRAYVEDSALQSICLKAALVLPRLVLQKPHRTSKKKKDHVAHLDCRH